MKIKRNLGIYLSLFFLITLLLASACTSSQIGSNAPTSQPHIMGDREFIFQTVFFAISVLIILYAFVFKPSALKEEEKKKFLSGLKKNDEVITSGGIFGRVVSVSTEFITLEITSNVRIKIKPEHVMPVPSKPATAKAGTGKETKKHQVSSS